MKRELQDFLIISTIVALFILIMYLLVRPPPEIIIYHTPFPPTPAKGCSFGHHLQTF